MSSVPEIFIKVPPPPAVIEYLNKRTHKHAIHAARLGLLLAGSAAAASLLSSKAAADSHVQTAAATAHVSAPAHVDFKIIIPQVLSLRVAGVPTVAVMSNSRNVTLSATGRSAGGGHVILSAAGRRIIAQDAPCAAAVRDALNAPLLCTVSMP